VVYQERAVEIGRFSGLREALEASRIGVTVEGLPGRCSKGRRGSNGHVWSASWNVKISDAV